MKLTYIQKNQFGNIRFFPDNDAAKSICNVANRKIMTPHDITVLQNAGFEIEIKVEVFSISEKSAEAISK